MRPEERVLRYLRDVYPERRTLREVQKAVMTGMARTVSAVAECEAAGTVKRLPDRTVRATSPLEAR